MYLAFQFSKRSVFRPIETYVNDLKYFLKFVTIFILSLKNFSEFISFL
jgi:hypothetical protein